MAEYNNYVINGKTISQILEDSANRKSSEVHMRGFSNGGVSNNSVLNFALYNSNYHPFSRIDTRINNYLTNSTTGINKNYASKGSAPVLNFSNSQSLVSYSNHSKTVIYSYKGTGDPLSNGTLYRNVSGTAEVSTECPSNVVALIVGAGGGGSGGTGWWNSGRAYGGGCGPVLIVNIELPYNATSKTEILKVELGAGGAGGGSNTSGSDGGITKLYFKQNNSWVLVATLNGGKGGEHTRYDLLVAQSCTLAITTVTFNSPINTSILSNGDGYGKITVNNSCRNYTWGSGIYAYLPGNYFDSAMDDSYDQNGRLSQIITSGDKYSYSRVGGGSVLNNAVYEFSTAYFLFWPTQFQKNYYGKASAVSLHEFNGGTPGSQGYPGNAGYWGSGGGGGGCPASGLVGAPSGGRGGAAGIKLFW